MPPLAILAVAAIATSVISTVQAAKAAKGPKVPKPDQGLIDASILRERSKRAMLGRRSVDSTVLNPLGVGQPTLGVPTLLGQ